MILFLCVFSVIFFSCTKPSTNSPSNNPYDGLWKLQVLEFGCGTSPYQDLTVSLGAYSTDSFNISCLPILSYTFNTSGNITSSGIFFRYTVFL